MFGSLGSVVNDVNFLTRPVFLAFLPITGVLSLGGLGVWDWSLSNEMSRSRGMNNLRRVGTSTGSRI